MDAFEAVSSPEVSQAVGQRYFSIAEANRSLVLVRRIVADIVRDYRRLCTFKETYEAHEGKGNIVLAEQTRQDYVCVFNRLTELREELEEIGCELKDYESGLVDFPTLREGREALLCWKLGEASVEHWHETDAGFSGRRPVSDNA